MPSNVVLVMGGLQAEFHSERGGVHEYRVYQGVCGVQGVQRRV